MDSEVYVATPASVQQVTQTNGSLFIQSNFLTVAFQTSAYVEISEGATLTSQSATFMSLPNVTNGIIDGVINSNTLSIEAGGTMQNQLVTVANVTISASFLDYLVWVESTIQFYNTVVSLVNSSYFKSTLILSGGSYFSPTMSPHFANFCTLYVLSCPSLAIDNFVMDNTTIVSLQSSTVTGSLTKFNFQELNINTSTLTFLSASIGAYTNQVWNVASSTLNFTSTTFDPSLTATVHLQSAHLAIGNVPVPALTFIADSSSTLTLSNSSLVLAYIPDFVIIGKSSALNVSGSSASILPWSFDAGSTLSLSNANLSLLLQGSSALSASISLTSSSLWLTGPTTGTSVTFNPNLTLDASSNLTIFGNTYLNGLISLPLTLYGNIIMTGTTSLFGKINGNGNLIYSTTSNSAVFNVAPPTKLLPSLYIAGSQSANLNGSFAWINATNSVINAVGNISADTLICTSCTFAGSHVISGTNSSFFGSVTLSGSQPLWSGNLFLTSATVYVYIASWTNFTALSATNSFSFDSNSAIHLRLNSQISTNTFQEISFGQVPAAYASSGFKMLAYASTPGSQDILLGTCFVSSISNQGQFLLTFNPASTGCSLYASNPTGPAPVGSVPYLVPLFPNPTSSSPSPPSSGPTSNSKSLGAGAVAGIIIGCFVGLIILVIGAIVVWHRVINKPSKDRRTFKYETRPGTAPDDTAVVELTATRPTTAASEGAPSSGWTGGRKPNP